jgi:hypothetical protein
MEEKNENLNPIEPVEAANLNEFRESLPIEHDISPIEPIINQELIILDTNKVVKLTIGAEFLDYNDGSGCLIRCETEDTSTQRKDELNYSIFGTSQESKFNFNFECIDKVEADLLWTQLIDFQTNPSLYVKEFKKEVKVSQIISNEVEPITPISLIEHKDYNNVPITALNIDELINSLPNTESNQDKSPIKHSATIADVASLIANDLAEQMQSYKRFNSSDFVWGYAIK